MKIWFVMILTLYDIITFYFFLDGRNGNEDCKKYITQPYTNILKMYQGEFVTSDVKFTQNVNEVQYLELIINSTTQSKLDDFSFSAADPRDYFFVPKLDDTNVKSETNHNFEKTSSSITNNYK